MPTSQLSIDDSKRRAHDRMARRPFRWIALAAVLVRVASVVGVLHAQVQCPVTTDEQVASTDYFVSSGLCLMCHSNAPQATALRDGHKRPVGPYDLWRTSMMANSSADPIWRAVVAAEVASTPSRKAEIEAKCLRCHTPMASVQAEWDATSPSRAQFLHGNSTLARLAADGVSCTVCHQIPPEGLGEDESFSGHFQIGDQGRIFGPHARPFSMPMYRHTGYMPTQSNHVRKSALCAACHTLYTDALSQDGSATGHTLLEQGPYVEWQNSQFNDETEGPNEHAASCQHCHAPTTDVDGNPIKTRIARNPHGGDFPPVSPRQPFGRHVFTGGNTLAPELLRRQLGKRLSQADAAALDATIESARQMLRKKTAEIAIQKVERRDRQLQVTVSVSNLTGHKLPTAYPSRRVWIRLIARDASGQVVFESGGFDRHGRIVDSDGANPCRRSRQAVPSCRTSPKSRRRIRCKSISRSWKTPRARSPTHCSGARATRRTTGCCHSAGRETIRADRTRRPSGRRRITISWRDRTWSFTESKHRWIAAPTESMRRSITRYSEPAMPSSCLGTMYPK